MVIRGVSLGFKAVCEVPVSLDCVPFSNIKTSVKKLLFNVVPGAVLFSGYPNLRYVGSEDEFLLSFYVRWHVNVVRVLLCNVSICSTFLAVGRPEAYQYVRYIRVLNSVIRVSGRFCATKACVWDIFVEDVCCDDCDDLHVGFSDLVGRVVGSLFDKDRYVLVGWLKKVFDVIDVGFEEDKMSLHSFLRDSVDEFDEMPYCYFVVKHISLSIFSSRCLAMICKFLQTFGSFSLPSCPVRLSGRMHYC